MGHFGSFWVIVREEAGHETDLVMGPRTGEGHATLVDNADDIMSGNFESFIDNEGHFGSFRVILGHSERGNWPRNRPRNGPRNRGGARYISR